MKKTADNGNAMPGWYWLEGHTEFSEVVRIAMKRILQGLVFSQLRGDCRRRVCFAMGFFVSGSGFFILG